MGEANRREFLIGTAAIALAGPAPRQDVIIVYASDKWLDDEVWPGIRYRDLVAVKMSLAT
jgi:hypothetical protein